MQSFDGKVAVVTGAGSGIGRALARRLGEEGMRVVLADVDEVAATDSARLMVEVDGRPEADVAARHCDVRLAESVEALADDVFATWGQVDVLCLNAGVWVGGVLWERPVADLEFALGVNVWGILHGIRAFVPRMIAQDTEGHVVNTCSVAGMFSAPFSGPYGVSKFAAMAATESLAHDLREVRSKIHVTALCPGIVNTDIAKGSERHRPAELATEVTADQEVVNTMLVDMTDQGLDPAVVAAMVVDAIRAERFLQLTGDDYAPALVDRAEALARRELPPVAAFT